MSKFESLPPDQQAVLSLLIRQGRTYAQVAALLAVDDTIIRQRAGLAIDGLGGTAPAELGSDSAGRVADYLLGQQDDSDRIETLVLLSDSVAARAWARAIARELAPVASVALPSVPEEPESPAADAPAVVTASDPSLAEAVTPSPPGGLRRRRAPQPPDEAADTTSDDTVDGDVRGTQRGDVNRGGGVLLIAGVLAIAAIVVFIVGSGGSSTPVRGPIPASAATETATSTTSATGSSADVLAEVTLKAAAGSKATGKVEVIKNGSSDELAISATDLPAPGKAHYVLFLYNSSTKYEALGRIPSVSSDGSVGPLGVTLPADASSYRGVALTLDASDSATAPGRIVLSGTSSSGF